MTGSSHPPIHHIDDGAKAIAATLIKRGIVQVKEAIPLRRMLSVTTDAVETFMRRRPDFFSGCGLEFGEVVSASSNGQSSSIVRFNPNVVKALCFSPIGEVKSLYFKAVCGTPKAILPGTSLFVRKYEPGGSSEKMLPFHQDQVTVPRTYHYLNHWTLLYPERCGSLAPGLEFILADLNDLIDVEQSPHHPLYGFLETSYSRIEQLQKACGTWIPEIELGDVVLFNGFALHRTADRGSRKARISAEVRFMPRTAEVVDGYKANGHPCFMVEPDYLEGPLVCDVSAGVPKVLESGRIYPDDQSAAGEPEVQRNVGAFSAFWRSLRQRATPPQS